MTPQEIDQLSWSIESRPLKDGTGQILVREFRWHGPFRGDNVMIVASPGFIWDGASIPRVAWTLIGSPFTGTYQRAALAHDILYETHKAWISGREEYVSREWADGLFRFIMKEDGTEEDLADQMWLAVRLGGSYAWRDRG
jgi:hypothetical protein